MTAAMAIKMGATTATLRRNARSCAAPLACQAAHRSSTLAASPAVVDEGASGTATDGTSMVMRPSLKGFGEGWARMAEGLRKADAISIFDQWECRCVCSVDSLRLLRGFAREEPVDVVRELAETHSCRIRRAMTAVRDRWDLDRPCSDQCCSNDRPRLYFQWIHDDQTLAEMVD